MGQVIPPAPRGWARDGRHQVGPYFARARSILFLLNLRGQFFAQVSVRSGAGGCSAKFGERRWRRRVGRRPSGSSRPPRSWMLFRSRDKSIVFVGLAGTVFCTERWPGNRNAGNSVLIGLSGRGLTAAVLSGVRFVISCLTVSFQERGLRPPPPLIFAQSRLMRPRPLEQPADSKAT